MCINIAGLGDYENRISLPEESLTMNNVASLPYLGSATIKTRTAMAKLYCQSLNDVLLKNSKLWNVI